jgi:hypothetical protein
MSESSDAPLTAETKALLARARRSFLFSIGLLILGLIAVGAVIVYKSVQSSPAAPSGADYVIAALKIPAGAQVLSAVAADGKLTVTYKNGLMTSVRIYDGKTGELLREIPVVSE